ncbi:MAG: TetR/AcrR family transcriptional regulator, partial [Actinomycetota bacterium]
INEQGYRGTSVDNIAARINLTKGAFYHHITTKDAMVLACFKRTFDIMRRTIIAAEATSGTGLQTLATIATTLVAHQITGEAPLLRVSAVDTMIESNQVEIMAGIDQVAIRIASVISDGIADGSVRTIDANVGAHMIMALINSADELPHFARGISPAEAVDFYVRPLFEGMLPSVPQQDSFRPGVATSDIGLHVDSV